MNRKAVLRLALGACGVWLLGALARGTLAWTAAFAVALCALGVTLEGGERRWNDRPLAASFWLALAAYLSTFHWRGGDDVPTALVPFAVLKHGTLALDQVMDPFLSGPRAVLFTVSFPPRTLSAYPVAAALLALPLYLPAVLARAPVSDLFLHNLAKIGGSVITAASVAAFYAAARRRASGRWAWAVTAVYAFGSWSFSVSSQALWQHGPAQLGLALALLGLCGAGRRDDLLCGFGLGLAVAARMDAVFAAAAVGAFLLASEPRRLPAALLGAAPWALQLGLYWLFYTGRLCPPEMGKQGSFFGGFSARALVGMLASPTRGLLFFCPAALFGAWAAARRPRSPAPWLLTAALAHLVFLSFYGPWTAGMSFGSRYLSGDALILLFLCADLEAELTGGGAAARLWAQAAGFSAVVHGLGAYLKWPGSFDLADEAAHVWDWSLHPIAQLACAGGPLARWAAPGRWLAFLAALALWQWLAARWLGYASTAAATWKPVQAKA